MRKTLFLILFAILAIGAGYGQYIVNFEGATETKTSYASGTVNLSGLDWDMTESLVGDSTTDWKNGLRAARMRGYGTSSISMLADKTTGMGTISFQYRRYGTDPQADWKVEYSTDGGTSWTQIGAAFTAPASDVVQTFSETANITGNIRVRIKRATESGTTNKRLNIDDITLTDYSGGSTTPLITVGSSLTSFSTTTGTPSASQSYTLSGSNLTANIVVAIPAGYEISTDNSTWLSGLSLASTYNGPVYVRMTGITAGTYNGNITHNSTGAAEVTLAVTGQVDDPVPTILPVGTLTAFNAIVGTPSAAQQYTLTGAFLTTNIVVAAPAGFELSTDGTTYSPGLSLASTFNGQIHVRLTGTIVGTYTGNITHNSSPAPEATVAVSGSVSNPVGPTNLFEENFTYPAGQLLTDNGWAVTGTTANPTVTVSEGSITYPGYYMYGGNAVSLATSGQDVNHAFTAQNSGALYSAFVINVTSAQATGDYFLHFGPSPIGTSYYGRVFLKRDGTTDNAFIGLVYASGTGAVVQYTPTSYPFGSNILLVLKYQIVDGTLNDEVSLFVNPTITGTEPAANLTSASGYTGAPADPASIGTIGLRQGSTSNAAVVKVDGIRVTNNWGLLWAGTPPPSPVITVTGELNPFTSTVNTPSTEIQSYTLTGSNLNASLVAQAPSGFQLSTNGIDGWTDTLTLASNFNGLVYVRMFATTVNTFEGDIAHTSDGATQVDLHVSGESFNPAVIWNITQNLQQFSQEAGTPSANQSYTLSATNATENLSLEVGAPFELSTTGTDGWLTTLSLLPAFNGTIYVRMNSATAGPFSSTIVHSTADASNYDIEVSGTATAPAGNYATDLFISEYLEGSSNNKALEIFNGTGAPVDLGNYKVYVYANGAATPGNTHTFAAGTMLAHNDVYVLTNAGANAAIAAVSDATSTATFYNGDDAVALVKVVDTVDQFVDIFGVIDQDPGTQWTADGGYSTLDKTLVRKPNITQGVSVNPPNPGDGVTFANAFLTLATEWDVYPIDTTTYLGAHVFTPGVQLVANPTFTPVSGLYYSPQTVTITSATPDASIYYTIDGTDPSDASTPYTTGFQVSSSTTVKAKAYKTGFTPSGISSATYTFPVSVSNIAALRASATGSTVYQLTGEAILTFQQNTSRHTKYIQDATAAIVIDDPSAKISTTYNLYDGITGISGTLSLFNGLLQFVPVVDPGTATSSGNVITPEVRTLASLTSADQAKLIKVMNATIDPTSVNFPSSASNITVTDASATGVLRTFASTDYVGTAIPAVPTDIVCLVGENLGVMQISPRFLADMTPSATGTLDTPIVTISRDGTNVVLNWNAITGAAGGYRIEADTNPYGSFTETYTVAAGVLTWSQASAEKKFYRVVALP